MREKRLVVRGHSVDEVEGRLNNGDSHGLNILADINIDTSNKSIDEIISIIIDKHFES